MVYGLNEYSYLNPNTHAYYFTEKVQLFTSAIPVRTDNAEPP